MKMIMAVISRDQADRVLDKLISAGYGATFTESRGGVLRQAQQMVFIATEDEKVDDVLGTIRKLCRTKVEVKEQPARSGSGLLPASSGTTAEVGYAVVFVWDLENFATY
jgi:uncharacterized protein YaaQ